MLLIAIDTSGRKGSVALCRGDSDSFKTLQLIHLEGGTYSALLMPTIAEMLRESGFNKNNLDGLVVVSGPGSFTGLRVGLATAKGLCETLVKPLAAVSMLEAVAVTHGQGDEVTAVLEAGRGEVYVGEYRVGAENSSLVREYIVKREEFPAERAADSKVLTPDNSVADALRSRGVEASLIAPVQADGVARIGLRKLLVGDVVDPAMVDVNYIRRSDAEVFSNPQR